ncbi:hypothetical protein VoSk93_05310 [Vibrio owensii]
MKMKHKLITGLTLLLSACSLAEPQIVATSGGAGTLGKPHGIQRMVVSDIRGRASGFIAGAVSGCCARSSIRLSVPNGIEGEWRRGWDTGGEWEEKWRQRWKPEWGSFEENYINHKWFRIKDTIDSDVAAKKIATMDNYFNEKDLGLGAMEVYVDGKRVVLAYVKLCNPRRGYDCSVKDNADPHGWVVPPPWSKNGKGTAVILYDGYGEESDKPFSE